MAQHTHQTPLGQTYKKIFLNHLRINTSLNKLYIYIFNQFPDVFCLLFEYIIFIWLSRCTFMCYIRQSVYCAVAYIHIYFHILAIFSVNAYNYLYISKTLKLHFLLIFLFTFMLADINTFKYIHPIRLSELQLTVVSNYPNTPFLSEFFSVRPLSRKSFFKSLGAKSNSCNFPR